MGKVKLCREENAVLRDVSVMAQRESEFDAKKRKRSKREQMIRESDNFLKSHGEKGGGYVCKR